ncbi:MAG: hypothetical protein B7Y45_14360 [Sphingomonas sp. 28-66-16]|nr:MAG: hypothetical protein B7Y45_14360 [Sphingomonas sp. 28-66-16]
MAKTTYGNRKAGILAHLSQPKRLALIAEGLPVIAASARSFWDAARQLEQGSREQNVLEGFAEEEAAKVLILMDMARCPPKQIAGRAGAILKVFYCPSSEHLAQLGA